MNKIVKAFGGIVIGSALAFAAIALPMAVTVSAADCDPTQGIQGGINCTNTGNTPENLFDQDGIFTTIINILLFIIGIISVVMLIIGGIRYTISGGDSTAVQGAKNTILYAIIGLVVAFLAFAVVNWVLGALTV